MSRYKNRFPMIAGIIYLLTTVTAVAYAWINGVHLYDFGISFSAYVGLHYPTSVMYFISAVVMITLITIYIIKTKLPLVKRIVYAVIFLCIFGTAFFPFNTFSDHPTAITIDLHNYFAIGLLFATTVSFVLSVVLSENKNQRIIAVLSTVYAVVFIVLYMTGFLPLRQTFFIWENLFIVLLLLGLHMEQYGELNKEKNLKNKIQKGQTS